MPSIDGGPTQALPGEFDAVEAEGHRASERGETGAHNIGVDRLVAQSRDVDDAETLATLYLHNMNAAFSQDT